MKTICIIPARGGSVRIPRKNIKPFHGRPIIEYSIETARRSMLFDSIFVSTDDLEVSRVARRAGASVFWRAVDDGSRGTQDVAAEVLRSHPAAFACVIYPCVPLLTPDVLVAAYQSCLQRHVTFAYAYGDDLEDAGQFYFGASYYFGVEPVVSNRCAVFKAKGIDINTPEDWARAERMYEEIHSAKSQAEA